MHHFKGGIKNRLRRKRKRGEKPQRRQGEKELNTYLTSVNIEQNKVPRRIEKGKGGAHLFGREKKDYSGGGGEERGLRWCPFFRKGWGNLVERNSLKKSKKGRSISLSGISLKEEKEKQVHPEFRVRASREGRRSCTISPIGAELKGRSLFTKKRS